MADPVDTTARSLAGVGCLLAIVGAACAWGLLALIAVLSWWVVRAFGFDDFFGPVLVLVLAMLVAIPLVGCWALLSGSTVIGRPLVAGGLAAALALLLVGLAIPAGWLLLAADGFSHPDSLAGWLTWGTTAAGVVLAGGGALLAAGRIRDDGS